MKFFHYIKHHGFGGVTIGYMLNDNKVTLSVAQCSDKDRYSKKIGRDTATEKFLKGEKITLSIKGDKKRASRTFLEEVYLLAADIAALRK